MSDGPKHVQFFGDQDRDFRLTPDLILEIERTNRVGIGALCRRVFAGEFSYLDLVETIRLGLIGGGETPEDAAALTKTYVVNRPLGESYPLAVAILECLWWGQAQDAVDALGPDDLQSIATEAA